MPCSCLLLLLPLLFAYCCCLQELVEAAKGKLAFAFREDGPPLGLEFDDIPPAAVLHSE